MKQVLYAYLMLTHLLVPTNKTSLLVDLTYDLRLLTLKQRLDVTLLQQLFLLSIYLVFSFIHYS